MAVFAPYLRFIWESAERFGLDPQKLFIDSGIDPALRRDANARISADLLDRLIWTAKQASHDDAFAFHLVENIHPSYFGVMGYAWLASETLRSGFELLSRYQNLLSDETFIGLEETASHLVVVADWSQSSSRDPELRERLYLSNVVRLCRMNCGKKFKPDKVRFMQAEPPRPAAYYTYFCCELEFGAESSCVLITNDVADRQLSGYDPRLLMMFEQQIIEHLAKLNKNDIVGRTKAVIFDQLPFGHASFDQIAERLCMSERTLRRRLKEEGTSFKELLAQTRRELGERYIQDSSLSLTEIAFMLGFSDSSSLSRAYKGWTGTSPSDYRSKHHSL